MTQVDSPATGGTQSDDLFAGQVARLARALELRGLMLCTAESCTGGWIAKALTDRAGSSAWFDCGLVTYSNAAKMRLLGVREATLARYGAVSEEVVREMAEGAVQRSNAQISVAVTGIAGPDGGSLEKPVGLVYHGLHLDAPHLDQRATYVCRWQFTGDREAVRWATVQAVLAHLLRRLEDTPAPA